MKIDKNIIANCFVTGILLIICGILMMVVPNDSFINDFSFIQSDFNIINLFMGEEIVEDIDVDEEVMAKKKETMYNMATDAINDVRTTVNRADEMQFFQINFLYLVPVGKYNCYKEYENVLSKPLEYFYVGVSYNGREFLYYVMVVDSSGLGINFISESELLEGALDEVVVENPEILGLKDIYLNNEKNTTYSDVNNRYLPLSKIEGAQSLLDISEKDTIEIVSSCRSD